MSNFNNSFVPYVVERSSAGERSYDLFSRLMEDRIVMLDEDVNSNSMAIAKAQLLFLNNVDKHKPIYLYINSPGGSVIDGLALIDTMNFITAPVYTVAMGMAASMGAAILSCGEKGHRYSMPYAQIMLHEVSGGTKGKCHENNVNTNYEKRLNNLLLAMIAKNCGKMSEKSFNEIRDKVMMLSDDDEEAQLHLTPTASKELREFKKITKIDMWLMSKKALDFGIVDEILTKEPTEED